MADDNENEELVRGGVKKKRIQTKRFKQSLKTAGTIDKNKFSIFGEVQTDKKKVIAQASDDEEDPEALLQEWLRKKKNLKLKRTQSKAEDITPRPPTPPVRPPTPPPPPPPEPEEPPPEPLEESSPKTVDENQIEVEKHERTKLGDFERRKKMEEKKLQLKRSMIKKKEKEKSRINPNALDFSKLNMFGGATDKMSSSRSCSMADSEMLVGKESRNENSFSDSLQGSLNKLVKQGSMVGVNNWIDQSNQNTQLDPSVNAGNFEENLSPSKDGKKCILNKKSGKKPGSLNLLKFAKFNQSQEIKSLGSPVASKTRMMSWDSTSANEDDELEEMSDNEDLQLTEDITKIDEYVLNQENNGDTTKQIPGNRNTRLHSYSNDVFEPEPILEYDNIAQHINENDLFGTNQGHGNDNEILCSNENDVFGAKKYPDNDNIQLNSKGNDEFEAEQTLNDGNAILHSNGTGLLAAERPSDNGKVILRSISDDEFRSELTGKQLEVESISDKKQNKVERENIRQGSEEFQDNRREVKKDDKMTSLSKHVCFNADVTTSTKPDLVMLFDDGRENDIVRILDSNLSDTNLTAGLLPDENEMVGDKTERSYDNKRAVKNTVDDVSTINMGRASYGRIEKLTDGMDQTRQSNILERNNFYEDSSHAQCNILDSEEELENHGKNTENIIAVKEKTDRNIKHARNLIRKGNSGTVMMEDCEEDCGAKEQHSNPTDPNKETDTNYTSDEVRKFSSKLVSELLGDENENREMPPLTDQCRKEELTLHSTLDEEAKNESGEIENKNYTRHNQLSTGTQLSLKQEESKIYEVQKSISKKHWTLLAAGESIYEPGQAKPHNTVMSVRLENTEMIDNEYDNTWILIARGNSVAESNTEWKSLAKGSDVMSTSKNIEKYKQLPTIVVNDTTGTSNLTTMKNRKQNSFYQGRNRKRWDRKNLPLCKDEIMHTKHDFRSFDCLHLYFALLTKIDYTADFIGGEQKENHFNVAYNIRNVDDGCKKKQKHYEQLMFTF